MRSRLSPGFCARDVSLGRGSESCLTTLGSAEGMLSHLESVWFRLQRKTARALRCYLSSANRSVASLRRIAGQ